MDPSRGSDSRYNLNYSMSSIGLSLADQTDIYGNAASVAALSGRPPGGSLIQPMGVSLSSRGSNLINTSQCSSLISSNSSGLITSSPNNHQRGLKRMGSDCYEDHHQQQQQHRSNANVGSLQQQSLQNLDSCNSGGNGTNSGHLLQSNSNVADVEESYGAIQNKKSPPANGKKTKGRVKIKMEYIDNKLRRYTTFSKRKTGIMKKAYELSTLTGTQVMLLVASETGHVYTFATRKLQPMITSEAGKQLIQTCLNSPDPPSVGGGDQRMSATGFEETELSYNIADEDSKELRSPSSSGNESEDSSDVETQESRLTNTLENLQTIQSHDDFTVETTSETQMKKQNVATKALNKNFSQNASSKTGSSTITKAVSDKNFSCENLSQDMILQLVQSGYLQLHSDEDGNGQYITIPLTPAKSGETNKTNQTKTTNTSTSATSSSASITNMVNFGNTPNGTKICGVGSGHVSNLMEDVDIKKEYEKS